MADLLYLSQNFSTTLNVASGIDASQTTGIILQSVTGLDTNGGILALDWTATIDTDTIEYVEYGGISGNELTGVVRGAEGVSAKTHANGATVVAVVSKSHLNRINAKLAGDDTGVELDDPVFNGDLTGTGVVDEDDMASDSATKVPTQQSVKAYVDASSGSADGWTEITDTLVYVSANSFKIVGVDRTAVYTKGTRIKLTQTSAKYFVVTGSSFATDTTVTITAGTDYTLASATITAPFYSYQAKPQGYPGSFAYTVTITPGGSLTYGSVTQDCTFSITGDVCTWSYFSSGVFGGSTNAFMDVTAPLQPAENRQYMGGTGVYFLSGVSQEICSFMLKITSSTTFQVSRYTSGNAFPASGTGILSWSWSYRI